MHRHGVPVVNVVGSMRVWCMYQRERVIKAQCSKDSDSDSEMTERQDKRYLLMNRYRLNSELLVDTYLGRLDDRRSDGASAVTLLRHAITTARHSQTPDAHVDLGPP